MATWSSFFILPPVNEFRGGVAGGNFILIAGIAALML